MVKGPVIIHGSYNIYKIGASPERDLYVALP
jgi:hypothetical protein